ncbi:VWA domain-containing protein [Nocardioides sp. WS12]|uniref:vWA domain-containing protein n=1 Tax=Nocardioides sp. WS12 TaxID=2486272 RepID=UPI0015FB71D5|nr:VWA domain-containing protein [Nocardioides sp. WS12]
MIDDLNAFVDELRNIGLPIALSDRMAALTAVGLLGTTRRETVEATLSATLVKSGTHLGAFRTVFDIYFARAGVTAGALADGVTALSSLTDDDLAAVVARAVAADDSLLLRLVAAEAVARHGGFEPGRPVGGTYYVIRTLRALDLGKVATALATSTAEARAEGRMDVLAAYLTDRNHERRIGEFRAEVEAEVRRLVAADRGSEALARTLRKPLPEDLDFANASGADLEELRAAVGPLARRLAVRLGRSRRDHRRTAVDLRATIRRSLAFGGVPLDLQHRRPRVVKTELVVVADISGSVASFAGFTLGFLRALASQFAAVRSFVFVDGLTEITDLVRAANDLEELIDRVNAESEALWVDGHSDYGHAFRTLADRCAGQFTRRTTVIILGDARNNYHAAQDDALARIRSGVGQVFWLNPEPRASWDTGDSIVSVYAPHCDEVLECRSLAQLSGIVEALG